MFAVTVSDYLARFPAPKRGPGFSSIGGILKLNIGSGEQQIDGYTPVDRKYGLEAYPLACDDGTVDEIRASHVLEHFSFHEIGRVLADWVRALKPGGTLKIAVPDFELIARAYLAGHDFNVQGFAMGGQVDENDYHKAIFDAEALRDAMYRAGLVNIRRWKSEIRDCAALPVSLNLAGTKPDRSKWPRRVKAVMSVPRLGFMDNFFCAFEGLAKLGISLRKHSGAFWGQCLERSIDESLAEGGEWILTVDYDTVFTKDHVEALLDLASRYPEADAIAPVQASRSRAFPLMTIRGEDGKNLSHVPVELFDAELAKVNTAHFGLTLIRADKLRQMPRPLFWSRPDSTGNWGDGREDDDIYFWREWEKAGNSLYLANRVTVGHAELMIRWPGRDFAPIHQHPSEFWSSGEPEGVWK